SVLVVAHMLVRRSVFGGYGAMFSNPSAGVLEIPGDLVFQGRHRLETDLIPQPVPKYYIYMLAIEFASKVEQVHFQGRLLAVHRRPQANVGNTVELPAIGQRRADHIHPLQRRHLAQQDIGGWRTELPAQLTAIDHPATNTVRMTQQGFGLLEMIHVEQPANPGTAYPLTGYRH